MPEEIIRAFAVLKKAAALANRELKPAKMTAEKCDAIRQAAEEILAGNWNPDDRMRQVLGETEHLRWCAFHYAMGYVPMSRMEFEANIEAFTRLREEGKQPGFRISKNREERKHACLVPWEDLDALSAEENRVTGRNV